MTSLPQNPNRGWFLSLYTFFSNPLVGIVGSIASVISIPLALYLYVKPANYRELVYLIHPAKAVILKSGQLSRLSVTLDAKPLTADVTAAQIAFWNNGTASIRMDQMLEPLKISTSPETRIIEASVRKRSRELVRIALNTEHLDKGDLGVLWNILEQGDGGVVQVIFLGPPTTPISLKAGIEGQAGLVKVETGVENSRNERYGSRNIFLRDIMYAYSALAAVFTAVGVFLILKRRKRGDAPKQFYRLMAVYFVMCAGLVAVPIVAWRVLSQPEPPFGF